MFRNEHPARIRAMVLNRYLVTSVGIYRGSLAVDQVLLSVDHVRPGFFQL